MMDTIGERMAGTMLNELQVHSSQLPHKEEGWEEFRWAGNWDCVQGHSKNHLGKLLQMIFSAQSRMNHILVCEFITERTLFILQEQRKVRLRASQPLKTDTIKGTRSNSECCRTLNSGFPALHTTELKNLKNRETDRYVLDSLCSWSK